MHRFKILLLGLWVGLFLWSLYWWSTSSIALVDVPDLLIEWLQDFGIFYAAGIYIVLYTIRPLILFPATLLTIASGIIFGPWLGIVFTVIGENMSANLAFFLARFFGRDAVKNHEKGFVKKWDQKLCNNGFITVLLMRLLYLPFDGVNYGCGFTSMRQRDFALGTFIGILPGIITFVLLGGTASNQISQMVMIGNLDVSGRYFVFGLSAFFFILGLIVAKLLTKYSDTARDITT